MKQSDIQLLLARRCLPQALALAPVVGARLGLSPAQAEQVILNTLASTISRASPTGAESPDAITRCLAQAVSNGVLDLTQLQLHHPRQNQ